MAGLEKAISEQIVRMTEEPEVIVRQPSESDSLIQAMSLLLEAYRQRLDGGDDIPKGFVRDPETGRLRAKVSDTFATNN